MGRIGRWLGSDLAPGFVLVAATLVALVLVNSPAGAGYESWWRTGFGPGALGLRLDPRHWVNDGLMTLFFFVIGLGGRPVPAELKRVVAPISAFLAVPLFALANAGVDLTATPLADALGSPVSWAVIAGLLVGKLIGVAGTITLATATGLGHLPEAVTTRHVIAKLGILAAAVIASAGAALALARSPRNA